LASTLTLEGLEKGHKDIGHSKFREGIDSSTALNITS